MKLVDMVDSVALTAGEEFLDMYGKIPDKETMTLLMSAVYHTLEIVRSGILETTESDTLIQVDGQSDYNHPEKGFQMLKMGEYQNFGEYSIELQVENHAVIRRHDNGPVNPTFYEMQYMKDIVFGGCAKAIEIFPPHRELVDGENQRHLFRVEWDSVPGI